MLVLVAVDVVLCWCGLQCILCCTGVGCSATYGVSNYVVVETTQLVDDAYRNSNVCDQC